MDATPIWQMVFNVLLGGLRWTSPTSPGRLPQVGSGRASPPTFPGDHRRWGDRSEGGLVVERAVATGDRDAELLQSFLETNDGLLEAFVFDRIARRSDVESVGDRDNSCAGTGEVAAGLGEGGLGAQARINAAEVSSTGDGDREAS